ncbi:hypothetical protein C1645_842207 [Glomus cerebriforme]|uniref:Uncharacterized protein n=1 Tax=Glomus cerebriforme TaxID=658196 RepID=A0A397S295_9GLOM|nr:hypothetical protein C1645_842207 [Glomus cerebriforme]
MMILLMFYKTQKKKKGKAVTNTVSKESNLFEEGNVLDILVLTDSDFEKLGISSIGIKTKPVRKAKSYS